MHYIMKICAEKLKLFTEVIHQLIDKWFTVVGDNILTHAISTDAMYPNKINNTLLFDFFLRG